MNKLTPSLLQLGGQFLASYTRPSHASKQTLADLGLPKDQVIPTHIGVQKLEEYYVLQGANIPAKKPITWSLSRIGHAVRVASIYIDSPSQDQFDFEVWSNQTKVFDFRIRRNQTPYDFPDSPLPEHVSIKINPTSNINFLRIALKPCVILNTLLPDEALPTN